MKHNLYTISLFLLIVSFFSGCNRNSSQKFLLSSKPQITNRPDEFVYKRAVKEMTVEEVTIFKGILSIKGNYKIHSTSAVRFLGFFEEKQLKGDTLLITLYPDFKGIGKDSKSQAEWSLIKKLNKEESHCTYVSLKIYGNVFQKTYLNQSALLLSFKIRSPKEIFDLDNLSLEK